MFYKMISSKRDEWYNSSDCAIKGLIDYILDKGQLRDAQIDAIKTYLYLKIKCDNKPMWQLVSMGYFNSLDLDNVELSTRTREFLSANRGAAALFEYAYQKDNNGIPVSQVLVNKLRENPESIDFEKFIKDLFYNVEYTDYLFSLPMGAGKTFLMAAFIYLDLYFAFNEEFNRTFSSNFIIFAPSGLKSSVIPSLRTIQNFDPSWIIPEPSCYEIKKMIKFEILDQSRTEKNSNKTKNPNVQKISNYQPFEHLFGLVLVTNAEKVILDRITENHGQISMFEDSDDDKDRQANELRNLIGKIPRLSVFVDEVHHAVSSEIKLRAVIDKWSLNNNINSVLGFSGTPYLENAESIYITENHQVSFTEISNIVYYYPLINGIGNFLKKPIVKISDSNNSLEIVESGVRYFLDNYLNLVYLGDLKSKLGIYCGTIEKLETQIYPLVAKIVAEYGLRANCILKYHKGNRDHPISIESQMQFEILDKAYSDIRIVLLVQIGKEGWDCKSLTGVILSQEGDCPRNMVLQTSCRCLRQVQKYSLESAIIYLNSSNAETLNNQLNRQHRITLKEFTESDFSKIEVNRYDRTKYLKISDIKYYQLSVNYETELISDDVSTSEKLKSALTNATITNIIKTTDFEGRLLQTEILKKEVGNKPANFYQWIYEISKSSFLYLKIETLLEHKIELQELFKVITYESNGNSYFSSNYDLNMIEANIRKSFSPKRTLNIREEFIPFEAKLLNIENFKSKLHVDQVDDFYPKQSIVENIILDDNGQLLIDDKIAEMLKLAYATGNIEIAESLKSKHSSHPAKDRSFHYLPYKTDSKFEQEFLELVLSFEDILKNNLEIYYNGERSLTEFKIKCYKKTNSSWKYIGMYTPDFLVLKRVDGEIAKALILETKGTIYSQDPIFIEKRKFMETEFIKNNNSLFGYRKFDYICFDDKSDTRDILQRISYVINEFFMEGNNNAN